MRKLTKIILVVLLLSLGAAAVFVARPDLWRQFHEAAGWETDPIAALGERLERLTAPPAYVPAAAAVDPARESGVPDGTSAAAHEVKPGVEEVPHPEAVVGYGAPPRRAVSSAQARLMAMGAAELDAQRQLLVRESGSSVSGTRTANNSRLSSYVVSERFSGRIVGARALRRGWQADGTAEVVMGLRDIPLPSLPSPQDAGTLTTGKGFTGLVIDTRGLFIDPIRNPKIVDSKGLRIYDLRSVEPAAAALNGLVACTRSFSLAVTSGRAGGRPMVVKAADYREGSSGPVIVLQSDDVKRIRRHKELGASLRRCRVVVVIDR